MRQCAQAALDAAHALGKAKRELEKLTEGDAMLERMGAAVGKATACVLFVKLGDPKNYDNPRAYVKAAGLNLAERSSGKYVGQLKISKRGPSMVRKWLYLAAVRMLKNPEVHAWYEKKRGRGGPQGHWREGVDVRDAQAAGGVVAREQEKHGVRRQPPVRRETCPVPVVGKEEPWREAHEKRAPQALPDVGK
jgi:transposase